MSLHLLTVFPSFSVPGNPCECLDSAVQTAISNYYAPNSWRSKRSAWKKITTFCALWGFRPVPASHLTVARYIAYLAVECQLKFNTINNYVSAVNTLHHFCGHSKYLAQDFFLVSATLRGFRRLLGVESTQKAPVTPAILMGILNICDPLEDSGFIAALLVGFFTLLRKANLVPPSKDKFLHGRHLSRDSFSSGSSGLIVTVRDTKTIQFKERSLELPLYSCHGSPLCPVSAVLNHFDMFPARPESPAFLHTKGGNTRPYTYSTFSKTLSDKIGALGLDNSDYSCHSLRRGGASFAHRCGARIEGIQKLGDWSSLAVLLYLDKPIHHHHEIARLMSDNISLIS